MKRKLLRWWDDAQCMKSSKCWTWCRCIFPVSHCNTSTSLLSLSTSYDCNNMLMNKNSFWEWYDVQCIRRQRFIRSHQNARGLLDLARVHFTPSAIVTPVLHYYPCQHLTIVTICWWIKIASESDMTCSVYEGTVLSEVIKMHEICWIWCGCIFPVIICVLVKACRISIVQHFRQDRRLQTHRKHHIVTGYIILYNIYDIYRGLQTDHKHHIL